MADNTLDPERGRKVADRLRSLGVRGILLTAAEQGYITELACAMPECHCPKELGGKTYFEHVPESIPEWVPTPDHINLKSQGGKLTVDNVRLAHRLCNRVDFAKNHGKPFDKDLKKVEEASERASSYKDLVLRTDRLELRPTGPRLLDDVWEAVRSSQDELAVWMPWAVDPDRDSMLRFLTDAEEAWRDGTDRHFAIFEGGVVCGHCSLDHLDAWHRSAEIGYWMRSDLCSQGLMTEAAATVVNYGFWTEGLHRIELHAGVKNVASIRVAQKLGFQKEGTLRHGGFGKDGFHDCHVYGRLAPSPPPASGEAADEPTINDK